MRNPFHAFMLPRKWRQVFTLPLESRASNSERLLYLVGAFRFLEPPHASVHFDNLNLVKVTP